MLALTAGSPRGCVQHIATSSPFNYRLAISVICRQLLSLGLEAQEAKLWWPALAQGRTFCQAETFGPQPPPKRPFQSSVKRIKTCRPFTSIGRFLMDEA